MDAKNVLKVPWTLEEIELVEKGVIGKTLIQAINYLIPLLPGRTERSIRTRVYEITLEDRVKKRIERSKKALNRIKTSTKLEGEFTNQENIIDEEEMVITSIEGDLKTKSQAIASNGPKLAYTDELIVKQGVISVPFMGEVRCNFRITGTFFIEKLD